MIVTKLASVTITVETKRLCVANISLREVTLPAKLPRLTPTLPIRINKCDITS